MSEFSNTVKNFAYAGIGGVMGYLLARRRTLSATVLGVALLAYVPKGCDTIDKHLYNTSELRKLEIIQEHRIDSIESVFDSKVKELELLNNYKKDSIESVVENKKLNKQLTDTNAKLSDTNTKLSKLESSLYELKNKSYEPKNGSTTASTTSSTNGSTKSNYKTKKSSISDYTDTSDSPTAYSSESYSNSSKPKGSISINVDSHDFEISINGKEYNLDVINEISDYDYVPGRMTYDVKSQDNIFLSKSMINSLQSQLGYSFDNCTNISQRRIKDGYEISLSYSNGNKKVASSNNPLMKPKY